MARIHLPIAPRTAFLAVLLVVTVPCPGPASGCDTDGVVSWIEGADLIVVGHLVDRGDPGDGSPVARRGPGLFTFAVDRLYKGPQTPEVEVLSSRWAGEGWREETPCLVFARERERSYWITMTLDMAEAGCALAVLDSMALPTSPVDFDRRMIAARIATLDAARTEAERIRSLDRLGWLSRAPSLTIPALRRWSRSGTEGERVTAVRALGRCRFSARTTPILLQALQDSSESVELEALTWLGHVPLEEGACATLRDVLSNHPNPRVRAAAATTMGYLPTMVRALRWRDLLPALDDSAPEVRVAAAWAIGTYGVSARDAYDDLARGLEDPAASVRDAALRNLWNVAPDRARPVIENGLTDPDSTIRSTSVRVAVEFNLAAPAPLVTAAVRDAAPLVQETGWEVWRGYDVPGDSSLVAAALSNPDPRVRLAVMRWLIGWRHRWELVEAAGRETVLRRLLGDESLAVRLEAVSALVSLRLVHRFEPDLEALARDPSPEIRVSALQALDHVPRSTSIVAALTRALEDDSETVRELAESMLKDGPCAIGLETVEDK